MFSWGDKGCEYRPDKCKHEKDDGCEWCCMKCNTDTHWCPICGTVANHKEEPCPEHYPEEPTHDMTTCADHNTCEAHGWG